MLDMFWKRRSMRRTYNKEQQNVYAALQGLSEEHFYNVVVVAQLIVETLGLVLYVRKRIGRSRFWEAPAARRGTKGWRCTWRRARR